MSHLSVAVDPFGLMPKQTGAVTVEQYACDKGSVLTALLVLRVLFGDLEQTALEQKEQRHHYLFRITIHQESKI